MMKFIDLDDEIYYSREFFKNKQKADIDSAIEDIKMNFKKNTGKYEYYSPSNKWYKHITSKEVTIEN